MSRSTYSPYLNPGRDERSRPETSFLGCFKWRSTSFSGLTCVFDHHTGGEAPEGLHQHALCFKWGHTTDQLGEGVSPRDERSAKWTTVVGHYVSITSDRRSEIRRQGGKGKDVIWRCCPPSNDDGLLHCRPYS